MTFGFPFVPLRDWAEATSAIPYLATGVDDNLFPAAGTYPPFGGLSGGSLWPQQEDC